MSAKARFLKKLQDQQPHPRPFSSKSEADIAEFCTRMTLLQGAMDDWLAGTGIQIESESVSVLDLFAGGSSFTVPGLALGYENRKIKFTPEFLYGQGVTGGVDVTLYADGKSTSLYRLFMRSSDDVNWSYSVYGGVASPRKTFSEDVFFEMIGNLLP
ncbi:hypothetical protein [Lelliottia sp. JS-SCA-14]|uniref:hypothetical protein n=1 Tax=Lelliottia sp. JS-SCA-14 TaxID=3110110 RepID=UPI002D7A1BA4|nr:hypothetical protein [Lelliottia sp. JS-SCA-14]